MLKVLQLINALIYEAQYHMSEMNYGIVSKQLASIRLQVLNLIKEEKEKEEKT